MVVVQTFCKSYGLTLHNQETCPIICPMRADETLVVCRSGIPLCEACLDEVAMSGRPICEDCARAVGLIPEEPLPGEECPVTEREPVTKRPWELEQAPSTRSYKMSDYQAFLARHTNHLNVPEDEDPCRGWDEDDETDLVVNERLEAAE